MEKEQLMEVSGLSYAAAGGSAVKIGSSVCCNHALVHNPFEWEEQDEE